MRILLFGEKRLQGIPFEHVRRGDNAQGAQLGIWIQSSQVEGCVYLRRSVRNRLTMFTFCLAEDRTKPGAAK
jgi:hypothetical protein